MKNIEEIFDNVNSYENNIGQLIADLRAAGINTYDDFLVEAQMAGIPIKKSLRDAVKSRIESPEEDRDDEMWQRTQYLDTKEAYMEYLDSCLDGKYRDQARNRIEELDTVALNGADAIAWEQVNKYDMSSLRTFVESHPDSKFAEDARKLINELTIADIIGMDINTLVQKIKEIKTDNFIIDKAEATYSTIADYLSRRKITTHDFLGALRDDNNLISSAVAKKLFDAGYLSHTDFLAAGIDMEFIKNMIVQTTLAPFPPSEKLEKITKSPCTEVYFWGIPSSGKSCALGAILSVANNGKVAKSMFRDPDCQGYGYMTRLANLFRTPNAIGLLPEGTPITSTYEMGMVLEDQKGKEHHLTCVDLAGELIECMYRHDAGEPLTDQQAEVLQTMTNILIDNRTENRKIHFFVIEYGAEDRLYKGLPQRDYLDAAVAYINRTGIFKKDTDALYILISKIDKANVGPDELNKYMSDYLSANYESFINGLKNICKKNEICGGIVTALPFTLGSVCFQNYCKFNPEAASSLVEKLLQMSLVVEPNKGFGKIKNIFRK